MTYVQIALAIAEFGCAWAAFLQVRGCRDGLLVPLGFVVGAAGAGLPLLYPVGHPTVVSVVLRVIALIALVLVADVAALQQSA
ncbi:hypothetical protein ACIQU5_36235 [Streptomyces sp. NPDC090306]|uniref:hypothetical protein n=1 Tax=Streptomyces sp. NPDC090306 TaxID=3365961 RepID=UPI0037F54C56